MTITDGLVEIVRDAVRRAEERRNPLLMFCNPNDTWTVLAGVRAATDRYTTVLPGGLTVPPRPITVCPRWDCPVGSTFVVDPLKTAEYLAPAGGHPGGEPFALAPGGL